jgi:hypothetical protein
MKFFLDLTIPESNKSFSYKDAIFLIGSCFTEHIGSKLGSLRFNTLQNPHGILFDSYAISHALEDYINQQTYRDTDLFHLHDVWHSWHFHSLFSSSDKENALNKINTSISSGHQFLKNAQWIIITLGSAFSYRLVDSGMPVGNCHKANQSKFNKALIPATQLIDLWNQTLNKLMAFNPGLNILFTISPVRHIRDGVVENNRSKAQLISTIHALINQKNIFYFPAYEYQIDVLRDYRFYDIDLVHPNFAATEYIIDRFFDWFLDKNDVVLLKEMKALRAAFNHRPMHEKTAAHKDFMQVYKQKCMMLHNQYPFLNLEKELSYFSQP